MEERESQVLPVECSMECSLLSEQARSHSAGTDTFLEPDWLRAVQFLVNKET